MSTDMVLCDACAENALDVAPTDFHSVDGCDFCDDTSAGHRVYERTT